MRISHAYIERDRFHLEMDSSSLLGATRIAFDMLSESSMFMLHARTGVPASVWRDHNTAPDAFIDVRLQPPTLEMLHYGVAILHKGERRPLSIPVVVEEHLRRFYQEYPRA